MVICFGPEPRSRDGAELGRGMSGTVTVRPAVEMYALPLGGSGDS
jgi:hypothetical protein